MFNREKKKNHTFNVIEKKSTDQEHGQNISQGSEAKTDNQTSR